MDKFLGIAIVTFSTLLYASLYPLLKSASKDVQPFTIMSVSMFVLFLLSVLASFLFEQGHTFKWTASKEVVLTLVLAGILNFIGFWLLIQGYKYMPVWQQTMFSLLTPIFAGVLSYVILGEKLSAHLFTGLAIMAVGLFVALQ